MSTIGISEGLLFAFIIISIVYTVLIFLIPVFVYTIRVQSIRTNQLLEAILKSMGGGKPADDDSKPGSVGGPVTCEYCKAEIPIKDYVPHVAKCMQARAG